MKHILVLVPFPMSDENLSARRQQLQAVELGADITWHFQAVKLAPKNYISAADMVLADIGLLEAGLYAERDGYDAICVDTMSDSGVAALRSHLSIPVFGPGRASMLTALMLGNRFSIITMWDHWRHFYQKHLTELGIEQKCASIRSINVAPDNQALMAGKEDAVFPLLEAEAMKAIDEDRAEVILLGSTTMHQAHAYLAERLPVPVINPGPLTYKLAELALAAHLTHSKKAYPPSPVSKEEVISAMLDVAKGFDH